MTGRVLFSGADPVDAYRVSATAAGGGVIGAAVGVAVTVTVAVTGDAVVVAGEVAVGVGVVVVCLATAVVDGGGVSTSAPPTTGSITPAPVGPAVTHPARRAGRCRSRRTSAIAPTETAANRPKNPMTASAVPMGVPCPCGALRGFEVSHRWRPVIEQVTEDVGVLRDGTGNG